MRTLLTLLFALIAMTSTASAQEVEPDYLCFELVNGAQAKIGLTKPDYASWPRNGTLEYSYDKKNWYVLKNGETIHLYKLYDSSRYLPKVYFRGDFKTFWEEDRKNHQSYNARFTIIKNIEEITVRCSGNIMTLIDKTGETTTLPSSHTFAYLFTDCPISSAPKLPSEQLTDSCYMGMFYNTLLSKAPDLPAKVLAEGCYAGMFAKCFWLKQTPMLSATTLPTGCYKGMFNECKKLKHVSVDFTKWTDYSTTMWLDNVSESGVFVCHKDLPIINGSGNIPDNWTVKYFEYIHSIFIGESSKNFITISETDEIVAGSLVEFSILDRKGFNASIPKVVGENGNQIEITNREYNYSFTMPNENVNISVDYTPIVYNVTCTDENMSVDKSKVTVNDKINFIVKDRTSEGYKFKGIMVNNRYGNYDTLSNYTGEIKMENYCCDVTIKAIYSKIQYKITTDEFSQAENNSQWQWDKKTATVGDNISISFSSRRGYSLTSVTLNGTELQYDEYNANFTMPASDVEIKTVYSLIEYAVICADDNVTADKSKATILDKVSFTVVNREKEDGSVFDKVLINNKDKIKLYNTETKETTEIRFVDSFEMKYFAQDVIIKAVYSKTDTVVTYTVTTDYYSYANKTKATVGDKIIINITDRTGYYVASVTCNGNPLTVNNNKAEFTMPAENVNIQTHYSIIKYNIITDEFVTVDKTKAEINDKVSLSVADRTSEGYILDKILVNNVIFVGTELVMKNYQQDITITAVYKKIAYTISTDEYSSVNRTTAHVGDKIFVTIYDRAGYDFVSATYNDNPLTVTNKTAEFTMPTTNVAIKTHFSTHEYTITANEFVTTDKDKATINDQISFSVTDRTANGYKLDKVLVNSTEIAVQDFKASFDMKDYLQNVTITAQYSKIPYTITTDEYSQVANTTANMGDAINVTFKQREGYTLTSATYNGNALSISDYKSSFTMPAANVEIKTQYTKIPYTISTDEYSQVANPTANMGDAINVTFKQREGYNLTSATYNGTVLSISDYKSSFTMPAANVEIKTVYAPITYAVSCTDANITADKTTATIDDKVNLTFKDRTSEGYKLDKVLVNSTEITVKDFKASFDMKDYLKDVTISAQYSQIAYSITTDEYSQVANTTATVDDAIIVTFKQREGFDLASATYNGNPLNIKDYKATFTMPAQDVEIKAVYAEKVYEIEKPSEGVSVSQPSAKAGDEITISVNPKVGYTVHLYVNGAEVALNGNSAVYTMPSGKIEITVKYVVEEKTPVSEIELDNCAVSVFPNPAKSGEEITLKVGGKFDMNNAKIYLYNASGSLVMQIVDVKEYNNLTLQSGVYVGVLVTKGGKKTFRVAVK